MNEMKFSLGETVKITLSNVQGTVVARAQYVNSENSYFVRHMNKNGDMAKVLFDESDLETTNEQSF